MRIQISKPEEVFLVPTGTYFSLSDPQLSGLKLRETGSPLYCMMANIAILDSVSDTNSIGLADPDPGRSKLALKKGKKLMCEEFERPL